MGSETTTDALDDARAQAMRVAQLLVSRGAKTEAVEVLAAWACLRNDAAGHALLAEALRQAPDSDLAKAAFARMEGVVEVDQHGLDAACAKWTTQALTRFEEATKRPSLGWQAEVGYNNNVTYRAQVFHIQTEDSGVKKPHVITHLFADGGRILKSYKRSYAGMLGSDRLSDRVRSLMKAQHKEMFIALREGRFDEIIEGRAPGGMETFDTPPKLERRARAAVSPDEAADNGDRPSAPASIPPGASPSSGAQRVAAAASPSSDAQRVAAAASPSSDAQRVAAAASPSSDAQRVAAAASPSSDAQRVAAAASPSSDAQPVAAAASPSSGAQPVAAAASPAPMHAAPAAPSEPRVAAAAAAAPVAESQPHVAAAPPAAASSSGVPPRAQSSGPIPQPFAALASAAIAPSPEGTDPLAATGPRPATPSFIPGARVEMPVWARLHVVRAAAEGPLAYELRDETCVIGRGSAVAVTDRYVGVRHAILRLRHGRMFIDEAEGALNGTYLRMRGPVELDYGDTFVMGDQLLRVEAIPPPADGPDASPTYFYSSPKWPTTFRVQQIWEGGAPGACVVARTNAVQLGRAPCDMSFPNDVWVSDAHCIVEDQGGFLMLTDLGSRAGTFTRIRGRVRLATGDEILVGRTRLRVEIVDTV